MIKRTSLSNPFLSKQGLDSCSQLLSVETLPRQSQGFLHECEQKELGHNGVDTSVGQSQNKACRVHWAVEKHKWKYTNAQTVRNLLVLP